MNLPFPITMWFKPAVQGIPFGDSARLIRDLTQPVYIYEEDGRLFAAQGGDVTCFPEPGGYRLLAYDGINDTATPGSAEFMMEHRLSYPYVAGGMAKGIASVQMVVALAQAGMLGFFGTGGLSLPEVEQAIVSLQSRLDNGEPFGINMISTSPQNDQGIIELLLKHGVSKVEVAGSITLSPAVVQYRIKGLYRDQGRICTKHHVFAKVSREEVASLFMSPPPSKIVQSLLDHGKIDRDQADMAAEVPMADHIIAEADSGGHTDNRPALLLFQNMVHLRNQMMKQHLYPHSKIRIGAAGGICTPQTAMAAFQLGADFVVTGSINQSSLEAGTSEEVKAMLSQVSMSDVANAPSADMFEMGSKVQVMTKGLMFHLKANKLYELYQNYSSLEDIPEKIRIQLEEKTFRDTLDNVWASTRSYFLNKAPEIVNKAEANPRVKMALVFRWYLGLSAHWAQTGEMSRKVDFQILCGPGMGAFNRWVKGTYLEAPENRSVVEIALNIMEGVKLLQRLQHLKLQGLETDSEWETYVPVKQQNKSLSI
ncbi:PfaD family polyunsaturated fatty acid/polyketide biosynthesis protein [Paenibacillus sp. TH7-28]